MFCYPGTSGDVIVSLHILSSYYYFQGRKDSFGWGEISIGTLPYSFMVSHIRVQVIYVLNIDSESDNEFI